MPEGFFKKMFGTKEAAPSTKKMERSGADEEEEDFTFGDMPLTPEARLDGLSGWDQKNVDRMVALMTAFQAFEAADPERARAVLLDEYRLRGLTRMQGLSSKGEAERISDSFARIVTMFESGELKALPGGPPELVIHTLEATLKELRQRAKLSREIRGEKKEASTWSPEYVREIFPVTQRYLELFRRDKREALSREPYRRILERNLPEWRGLIVTSCLFDLGMAASEMKDFVLQGKSFHEVQAYLRLSGLDRFPASAVGRTYAEIVALAEKEGLI